jgi:hypothetical protein
MARINIYVPDELKARMDSAGDTVNWSEVARPAIQAAVANFEHRKGQTMTTAIERLRASKAESAQASLSDGRAGGRQWAENHASYKELRRLMDHDLHQVDAESALRNAVDPKEELDYHEFLHSTVGADNEYDDEYIEGFAKGAQEFFAEVYDKL